MSIAVTCAGCGKSYKVDDAFAGKRAKCKSCGGVMQVPGTPVAAKPATAAAPVMSASAPKKLAAVTASPEAKAAAAAARRSSIPKQSPVVVKQAAVEDKEFDFSALDDIENTGTIDHNAPAVPFQRPTEKVERPRYTAAPAHLRAMAANGGRLPKGGLASSSAGGSSSDGGGGVYAYGAGAAAAPFWSWENLQPGVGGYLAIGLLVIGIVCLFQETMSFYGGAIILVVGIGHCVYGVVQPMRLARQESFVTYLMYRFIPLYAAYFVISRWYEAKKAAFAWMKGAALVVFGMLVWIHGGGIHRAAELAASGASRNSGGSASSGASSTNNGDDDDGGPLTAAKLAHRAAKRRQAEIDAIPNEEVKPAGLPLRAEFPALGDVAEQYDCWIYRARLDGEFDAEPMDVHLLLPAKSKDAKPHSLPCVMMAARTDDVLQGATLTEREEKIELSMGRAGVPMVSYDTSRWSLNIRPRDAISVYTEFIQRNAGAACARNAFNWINARTPMIDPNRVFVFGIGGSARTALVYAALEPKVAGVVVIDPVCDPAAHLMEPISEIERSSKVGGIQKFLDATSPILLADKIKCPVLVIRRAGKGFSFGVWGGPTAHGEDATAAPLNLKDDNDVAADSAAPAGDAATAKPTSKPVDEVTAFVNALKAAGGKVTVEEFKKVPDTDDQDALMGQAARWVKKQGSKGVFAE